MGKHQENKKRVFEIPKEMIVAFFTQLEENNLDYELKEVGENEELIIEVGYSESEKGEVMDLIELLDEYSENEEETEEEEDK